MQVCILLQTDNHASTPPLSFYRPDALPAAQPTASKHWRKPAPHLIIYGSLDPPSGTSIGAASFVGLTLTVVANNHTDMHLHHATSVTVGHVYALLAASLVIAELQFSCLRLCAVYQIQQPLPFLRPLYRSTWVRCHLQLRTGAFVGAKFYCLMPLLMAASTFRLGRRHWSSPQQCYLHCLRTLTWETECIEINF